ncbi:hypothetical protein N7462_000755 [Penicillium macrosclerotiorum]|uniref:uncharacterized protein n=1 Tax=Penicillium macrosclerotiorum TaxID=303699 RepID=UPI002549A360|nr:uncharacterized protein N7462_000755 [Penicillium macrosclerotiorum]KAJ5698750.1 hypothetical protein N7462_000755 [Penicillium macrosclerotiorum]
MTGYDLQDQPVAFPPPSPPQRLLNGPGALNSGGGMIPLCTALAVVETLWNHVGANTLAAGQGGRATGRNAPNLKQTTWLGERTESFGDDGL